MPWRHGQWPEGGRRARRSPAPDRRGRRFVAHGVPDERRKLSNSKMTENEEDTIKAFTVMKAICDPVGVALLLCVADDA
jgi:hypothetical protein